MRNPNVYLPDNIARCVDNRMNACAYADTCARALAPIPKKYAVIEDFSRDLSMWSGCGDWISAVHATRPAPHEPARPIHPAPHGI